MFGPFVRRRFNRPTQTGKPQPGRQPTAAAARSPWERWTMAAGRLGRALRKPVAGRAWQALACGLAIALLAAGCGGSAQSQDSPAVDSDFEAKVLQVIRDNPDVILESVAEYNQRQSRQRQDARAQFVETLKNEPAAIVGDSPVLGDLDGSVVLLEFSDFQCPFCARAQQSVKQFLDEYGDRVALSFKHFPLTSIHDQAFPAARAAWAAQQQGQFWDYQEQLFARQDRLGDSLYESLAEELGLDLDRFNRDRASDEAEAAVQQDFDLAVSLGLEGTPTFLMDGDPLDGPPSVETFKAAYEKAAG